MTATMQQYLLDLVTRLGTFSYAIVFLVAALECAAFLGLIVPGESVLLACGFLAHSGVLSVDAVIVAGVLGAITGDNAGYWMGHRLGEGWLLRVGSKLGVTRERLESTHDLFARHGAKAVFLGRFVGYARALVPFVAGTAGMPRRSFFIFNAAGALLWGTGIVLLGYGLGASWRVAELWLGRWSLAVLILSAVAVLVVLARRRLRQGVERPKD